MYYNKVSSFYLFFFINTFMEISNASTDFKTEASDLVLL